MVLGLIRGVPYKAYAIMDPEIGIRFITFSLRVSQHVLSASF